MNSDMSFNELVKEISGITEMADSEFDTLQKRWDSYLQAADDRETMLVELKNREIEGLKDLLRETNKQMLFINEVGQQITASLDLESVVRTFHRTTRDQIPSDRLLFASYQPSEDSLYYRYYGDETQEQPEVDTIFLSSAHRMVVESITEGRPRIENFLVPEDECFLTSRGGSLMIQPLRLGTTDLGALVLHTNVEGAYAERHRQLLVALSIFISVAVSNARSHLEVSAKNEELKDEKADLISSYARITRMANYDSLTDLPNLRLLNEFLPRYMNQARRRGWTLGVFFIDLDDFKPVNDQYGHDAGDALLMEAGHRIQFSLRQSDIVARVGGDEFIALVQGLDGEGDAENIIAKVLDTLSDPFFLREAEVSIGASVGISLYNGGDETPDLLKRQADSAMYEVKRGGKHGFNFYQDGE